MTDKKISDSSPMPEDEIDPENDLVPIVDASEALDVNKNKTVAPAFFRRAVIQVACSDETTALTTGTAKATFRVARDLSIAEIRAALSTAQATGSTFTVDVKKNGATLFSTTLTIDNTEKTSTTAATAAVLSTTTAAADDEITIDISQVGDGTAKGLKVTILGTWTS